MKTILILLLAVSSTLLPQTRDIVFERLGPAEGISHGTVTDLIQDSRGFIWIATLDGLNRFDGQTSRVYRHDPENSNSISSSFIHGVIEDRSGILWITTRDGGLNRFDPRTERFTRYRHDPANPHSLLNNKCGPLLEDSRGRLWVGTDDGLDLFDRPTERFLHYRHTASDSSTISWNEVTMLAEDRSGVLWVGTVRGFNRFDPAAGTFQRFLHDPGDPSSLENNFVNFCFEDREGLFWVATGGGVRLLDRTTGKFLGAEDGPEPVRRLAGVSVGRILQDRTGSLWFGTAGNGLFLFNPASGKMQTFRYDPSNSAGISHNNLSVRWEDDAGTLWLTTWGGGINRIVPAKRKFQHERNDPNNPASLNSNFVFTFHEDRRGRLWIGTAGGGLSRWDEKSGTYVSFMPSRDGTSISSNAVWCITGGRAGGLWVGTESGLNFMDAAETFRTINHPLIKSVGSGVNAVKVIHQDRHGVLWLGTNAEVLSTFNPLNGAWKHLFLGEPGAPRATSSPVWCIREDREGVLWVGTFTRGLLRIDRNLNILDRFMPDPARKGSLGFHDIRSVHEAADGTIWVGTYGGGLNRFNRETRTFSLFTEKEGLANNFIYGILEDRRGNLWLSSNKGVTRFHPATGAVKNFSTNEGLQADEFNTGAFTRTSAGDMLFGGVNGFNRFHPESILENSHVPPVVLTNFKVFDKEMVLDTSATRIKTITLQYEQNMFSFEFAALDYVDPGRNQYAYYLEGFDAGWINAGTRRYTGYTNLDPGKYVFHVKGSNNDGVWNEEGTSVAVVIVPPFWMTAWFRILAGVMAIAMFGGMVRYISTRNLQKQIHELEQERGLQEERDRISRDLHDHAGAQFANIISGLELAERYSVSSSRKTNRTLKDLIEDARFGMGQLRETIWALKANAMEAQKFCEELERYSRRLFRYRRSASIQVRCEAAPVTLSPIQVLNLYRIAQEALTNILKHSKAKTVTVVLSRIAGSLTLEIRNDGSLVKKAGRENSGGQGLLNMERRARELGGKFEFLNLEAQGTLVRVRVPLEIKSGTAFTSTETHG